MNKAELIEAMSSAQDCLKLTAKALDSFIDATSGALRGGDRVALVGFGSWSICERAARTGLNPKTKQKIQIGAKKVVKQSGC